MERLINAFLNLLEAHTEVQTSYKSLQAVDRLRKKKVSRDREVIDNLRLQVIELHKEIDVKDSLLGSQQKIIDDLYKDLGDS